MRWPRSVNYGLAQPPPPVGSALDEHPPALGVASVRQYHIESIRGQQAAEPVGPFDQRYALRECILDTEFAGILRGVETKQVEMPDRRIPRRGGLIDLHQRESRARYFIFRTQAGTNEGAGEHGLADAEVAHEGDDVASSGDGRKPCRQHLRLRLVAERAFDFKISVRACGIPA